MALRVSILVIVGLSAASWWLLWTPSPMLREITSLDLNVGAAERNYLAFVPHDLAPGAPALIVLHGTGQTGNAIRAATGAEFEVLAQRHGFLVAYPDGMNQQWNDCRPKDDAGAMIDDVGFVSALIGDLASRYGTNPSQTFLFGFSNGGQMVFRLLSEEPEHFAGAATMGANLPTADYDLCDSDRATPRLLLAQGTEDPIVPFHGGKVTIFGVIDRGMAFSAERTAQDLARRNGLGEATSDELAPDVLRWRWDVQGEPWIERLAFNGAGHVVPQPVYRFPRLMGSTPRFSLPSHVVGFFGLDERG